MDGFGAPCVMPINQCPQGVGQALGKNYIPFLGMWKVHMGFTEIKQVSARSIQVCQGINGDQCLEHFCSEGRTFLRYWKVREIPVYG